MTQHTAPSPEVTAVKARLGIIGNAPALNEAVQRALTVAPIDLSVLITGESGTGKEFFPQIIHLHSARKHAKYIAVNCGAIPEGTIDSELFGHEKGSFTGAVASRKGYFEEADGGTIFLDEVAELPLTTQARLLRVLETGEYLKVGSSAVQRANVRIVAATNVDMARAVADGRFREDLYYRLSTVQIHVPPLRDRAADIPLLARKFAADFAERYRMPEPALSPAAQAMMHSYRWPGNVRQLKNVVEQISLFEAGREVTADTLSHYLPADAPAAPSTAMAVHTSAYDREREMLFNIIFRLQKEIAELRAIVTSSAVPAPVSAPLPALPLVGTLGASVRESAAPASDRSPLPDFSDFSEIPETTPDFARETVPPVGTHGSCVRENARETTSPVGTHGSCVRENARENASLPPSLEDTEREAIRAALDRNDGRRAAAARELNISERTLYRKIKEYGLDTR